MESMRLGSTGSLAHWTVLEFGGVAEAILDELQEQRESPVTGKDKAFCPVSTSLSLAISPEIHTHTFTLTHTLTHIHTHAAVIRDLCLKGQMH